MKQSEDQLQMAVVEWLNIVKPDCQWFHVPNSAALKVPQHYGAKLKKMGLKAGVADLVFVWGELPWMDYHGDSQGGTRVGYIELKIDTGRQRLTQKLFEAKAVAHGADYRIARSLDDVRKILAHWGLVGYAENAEQAARKVS